MEEAFSHKESEVARKHRRGASDLAGTAPDGGWGYAVCLGVGVLFMLGFGSSSAFGILFNDFFEQQGDGASGLTLVIGVYNGSLSVAGFFAGIALKSYSFRKVGLVGAALFVVGDAATVFVESTAQLVLAFGLLRGAGFGMMIPVAFTAFNCYFERRRTAMMSANQTLSSLASITFPIMVTRSLEEYGFRPTLALIAAIDLHLVAAMLVMRPVTSGNNSEKRVSPEEKDNFIAETPIELKERHGEVFSITAAYKNRSPARKRTTLHKFWLKICQQVELDLLRQPRFLSVLVGIGFAFVSDVTYLALEPMLLFDYGFSNIDVAYCVMLGAVSDLLCRFLLAVYSARCQVDSRSLFYVGVCITVVMRIALVCHSEYWYVSLVTVLGGCVRCTVQVLFPLVLAAAAPHRFPAALALHILFSGSLMLLADPIIGLIYRFSQSYVYCFVAMSACCLVTVILWTAEYVFDRRSR